MSERRPYTMLSHAFELLALSVVPLAVVFCTYFNISASAGITLLATVLALAQMAFSLERDRPLLRQLMPTVVLAALAAAGRLLFSPFPDMKPVSAICIVAGAVLNRRSGFATGALAALVSNFYFGQGPWTALQMYAWGLIGYLSGVFADVGLFNTRTSVLIWGFLSGLLYGVVLNSWHVIGYVRPLNPQTILAAFLAGIPLDILHGLATVAFLALIWVPWERSLKRVLAKYNL